MNIREDNNQQGKMNTPIEEAQLVVDLNYDILKTIQSLQEDLQSFKDANMNEIKEQQAINKSLLCNLMGGRPQGKPTHSTIRFKKGFYHKRANNPRKEEKEEHTPEP